MKIARVQGYRNRQALVKISFIIIVCIFIFRAFGVSDINANDEPLKLKASNNSERIIVENSIRGSILDVFPIGSDSAFRLDFLGEEIETIKFMDPLTQRSNDLCEIVNIYPQNEYLLTKKNIENFRKQFKR